MQDAKHVFAASESLRTQGCDTIAVTLPHKQHVLLLYGTRQETIEAFNARKLHEDVLQYRLRNLTCETTDSVLHFVHYCNYETVKTQELHQQWCRIEFHLDLQQDVILHFKSRLRCSECNKPERSTNARTQNS